MIYILCCKQSMDPYQAKYRFEKESRVDNMLTIDLNNIIIPNIPGISSSTNSVCYYEHPPTKWYLGFDKKLNEEKCNLFKEVIEENGWHPQDKIYAYPEYEEDIKYCYHGDVITEIPPTCCQLDYDCDCKYNYDNDWEI